MTRRHTVEHGACSCRRVTELYYHEDTDEYLCDECLENAAWEVARERNAERDWERQQARDLESPPESAREEQIRTWKEHQEAHKR